MHWESNKTNWSRFLEDLLDYCHQEAILDALDWIKEEKKFSWIFTPIGPRDQGKIEKVGKKLMMGEKLSHEHSMTVEIGGIKYALQKIFAGWISAQQAFDYSKLNKPETIQGIKDLFIKDLFNRLSGTRKEEFARIAKIAETIPTTVSWLNLNFIEPPGPKDKNLINSHQQNSLFLLNDLFGYARRKNL